jgi:hypothetical protein
MRHLRLYARASAGGYFLASCAVACARYDQYVQFRLTVLLSVLTVAATSAGCAAEEGPASTLEAAQTEKVATVAAPVVGTWRWTGSGGRIGDIALGEEQFVFRDDGTYAVASTSGDGATECYGGTFTWSTVDAPDHGTIVFKGSHVADTKDGFAREVYLGADGTLHFGEGGTYRRTESVVAMACP